MIALENVSKSFDGKEAVKGLSLSVPRGEVFGLLGPNGAGKTTAIRMMTGLLMPDSGRVLMAGHDVAKEPMEAKSLTGLIPDRPFFYDLLTAREFLAFLSSIYGLPKNEALRRIEELLELFSLAEAGGELIEGYSQGMRQRLLFASALIHSPEVLVIDEPVVGLDPFGVALVKDLIRKLSSEGMTVFLATHSLHIAGELCHRVALIDRGALVAVKSKDEILRTEGGLEGLFTRLLKGLGGQQPPAGAASPHARGQQPPAGAASPHARGQRPPAF